MKILVVAEQRDNKLKKSSFEAAQAAAALAAANGGEAVGLVIGDKVGALAAELGKYGVKKVLAANNEKLAAYSTTAFAKAVAMAAAGENAQLIVMAATAMGKDLAPRIAAKLNAGFAADCTALEMKNGSLIATRPVYAGKALLEIKLTGTVNVVSLRPNAFPAGVADGDGAAVEELKVEFADADLTCAVTKTSQSSAVLDVAEADIIVSGGRGMKGPEHFAMLEELAGVLGGAVGASRAVVDAGWRPHAEQVGQTGKTVSPTLYIAVGVSGAIQHLAGMSSSKYIVAVNKDKDAPIFQVADYGVVGDAFEVIPALTEEVRKLSGK